MLSVRTILRGEGVELADVVCRHPRGQGQVTEHTDGHVIVFVRRGCFVRRANGVETLLDATVAYCMNTGDEQRYDHPHDHGDVCTSLYFDADVLASIWAGDPILPAGPLAVSPQIDLEHRLLVLAARNGADSHELVERAIALTARALEGTDPRRVAAGRPSTARARRALVDGVREATGHTIARHRMRLRVRNALNRMADGERDLARLAADVGFTDHSHLCRVVRSETGHTPSALRRVLA